MLILVLERLRITSDGDGQYLRHGDRTATSWARDKIFWLNWDAKVVFAYEDKSNELCGNSKRSRVKTSGQARLSATCSHGNW